MMYTVVRHFTDLLDKSHRYLEGDVYPREGYTPSPERIAELSSENNKQKIVLIKAIPEEIPETVTEVETVETSAEEEPTPQEQEEEKPKKSTKRSSKKAE